MQGKRATTDSVRYRPQLDGIRAVSIMLVLIQHVMGTTRFYAGATGVALFFALSGYLITGVLLDELARDRLSLPRFYLRRTARLLPGLVAMLSAGSLLLLLGGAGQYLDDVVPSLLYVNNYASILAGPTHLNLAFGHTWSLAVEEHFYLLWPLALIAMRRRAGLRGVLLGTLGLCLAALLYRAVLIATVHPSAPFFYFDSGARVDSILYGCAACVAVRVGWRPSGRHLAAALVLLSGYLLANRLLIGELLGSLVSGMACAVVVASVDHAPDLPTVRGLLGARPLRRLGERSYSVYLWHLPVIAYAIADANLDRPWLRAVAALFSLPIAFASYRWIESPVRAIVRRWSERRRAPAAWEPPARSPAVDEALARSGQASSSVPTVPRDVQVLPGRDTTTRAARHYARSKP